MSWDEAPSKERPESSLGPVSGPDQPAADSLAEKIALEFLAERRRARKWGVFFKLLVFIYLTVLLLMAAQGGMLAERWSDEPVSALVELNGIIGHDRPASADNVVAGLRAAFREEKVSGVILRINSPGGSPVQAGYINDEIYRLREEHPDKKLYAVIEDVGASGGYYVAAAADKIFADKASLIGSIGVRMDGFGFVDTLQKLGIERRLLTSGENKGFLDPFSPTDPEQKAHAEELLREIHQQFINTVLKGRREQLSANADAEIFSGLVWTGEQSLELGLVDELGSAGYVAREVLKAEKIVDFTPRQLSFSELLKRGAVLMMETIFEQWQWR